MTEQTLQLPREGERIGSGIVLSLLGTGGSAAVYKTWIDALELHRAVKVIHPDASASDRERIQTEARISSKLLHQNIVHVHNYGETAAGLPYLEMDYVNGPTLAAIIEQRGALPLPVAAAVAVGMLEALHCAHTLNYTLRDARHTGVMHRDVKPANVILSADSGLAKLTDFGIARPVEVSIHTAANNAPGTIAYMSPEACAGGDCDFRSDIYQIGLLLYECITGRAAFPQSDLAAVLKAITTNQYEPLIADSRAAAVVERCMALDPAKRYQTALGCLSDVRSLYIALCRDVAPEQVIKAYIERQPLPTAKRRRNYLKPLKTTALAASLALIATAAITAAVHYSPLLIGGAAKVYAAVRPAAAGPDEPVAETAAPETPATATEPAKPTPPKAAPAQQAAKPPETANEEDALHSLRQADALLFD